jgi:hypothetical protein
MVSNVEHNIKSLEHEHENDRMKGVNGNERVEQSDG